MLSLKVTAYWTLDALVRVDPTVLIDSTTGLLLVQVVLAPLKSGLPARSVTSTPRPRGSGCTCRGAGQAGEVAERPVLVVGAW